jgi:hypothetical protein
MDLDASFRAEHAVFVAVLVRQVLHAGDVEDDGQDGTRLRFSVISPVDMDKSPNLLTTSPGRVWGAGRMTVSSKPISISLSDALRP